jgi:hypothetical protein
MKEHMRIAELGDAAGTATPNQFGTTLSAMANSIVVTWSGSPVKASCPGGGTEPGTTTHSESCQVPVPLCTPGMASSEICVTG